MTLNEIAVALRPQFIWENSTSWKTSKEFEGGRYIGITVFLGVSTLNGFSPADICSMLNISLEKYEELLEKYKKQIIFASHGNSTSIRKPYKKITYEKVLKRQMEWRMMKKLRERKVYTKSLLVQSYLVHKFGANQIIFSSVFTA